MKTKVVVVVAGGMVAVLLLWRYVALSRAGMPLGWMLYLGLPITAVGLLFALRLASLGAGWSIKPDAPQPTAGPALPPSGPSLAERLRELDLQAEGAISDTEYCARRLRLLSGRQVRPGRDVV